MIILGCILSFLLGLFMFFLPESLIEVSTFGKGCNRRGLLLGGLFVWLLGFLMTVCLLWGWQLFEGCWPLPMGYINVLILSLALLQIWGCLALSHPLRKRAAGLRSGDCLSDSSHNYISLVYLLGQRLLGSGSTWWPYYISWLIAFSLWPMDYLGGDYGGIRSDILWAFFLCLGSFIVFLYRLYSADTVLGGGSCYRVYMMWGNRMIGCILLGLIGYLICRFL